MSKSRMAGEKLDERFGEGFTDRVKGDGLQDPTAQGGYSRKELLAEFRGRDKGVNINEGEGNLVNKFQGLVDSGEKFNGKAQSYLESHGVTFGGGGNNNGGNNNGGNNGGGNNTNPNQPSNGVPTGNDPIDSSMSQNVNQDNDINTDINGDNNTVVSNQDNSIRQYGGNTKSFNYQGGKGQSGLYDSPVSAGTMGGFFHDEDSPASSASFVDRYSTMNKDAQKKYNNTGIAAASIGSARNNKAINVGNLDSKIEARSRASRARSKSMAGNVFGDMFNFNPVDYKSPEAPDPIEGPNFNK